MNDLSHNTAAKPIYELIDLFPKLLAITSAAIVVMAASHECAYFIAIGSNFQSLLSAYNYIANAIVYLPYYLLTTLGFFSLGALSGWLTGPAPPGRENTRRIFVLPNYFYAIWLFIFIGSVLAYFVRPEYEFYNEVLLAISITLVIVGLTLQKKEVFPISAFGITFALFLILYIFSRGLSDGYRDLEKIGEVHTIEFKSVAGEPKRENLHAKLLRSLERGILVNDILNRQISYFRWEEIAAIRHATNILPERSLGCLHLRLNCPAQPVP